MANIILCDIDGTVANNDHRQHFLEGKKDWEGFFKALDLDRPIHKAIKKISRDYEDGKEVIFLTGRPERYRLATEKWLKNHFDFQIKVLMRPDENKKDKLIAKMEIFEKNFDTQQIFYVLDNDKELIELWKSLHLKVIDVEDII